MFDTCELGDTVRYYNNKKRSQVPVLGRHQHLLSWKINSLLFRQFLFEICNMFSKKEMGKIITFDVLEYCLFINYNNKKN